MKKLVFGILAATIVLLSCEGKAPKTVDVKGNWEFSKHIEGTGELSVQEQAMVKSIVSVFQDGSVNYKEDGTLTMESPRVGKRTGTYSINDGKLEQKMGENSQFILHVQNEGENLAILFNEGGDASVGKIILTKKN